MFLSANTVKRTGAKIDEACNASCRILGGSLKLEAVMPQNQSATLRNKRKEEPVARPTICLIKLLLNRYVEAPNKCRARKNNRAGLMILQVAPGKT